jgi:hypothetical protein
MRRRKRAKDNLYKKSVCQTKTILMKKRKQQLILSAQIFSLAETATALPRVHR